MEDVLGYAGRRAVVTGAASGMGAAAAALLTELGAEVTAIDVKPVELAGATSLVVDLRDKAAIDEAVGAIGEPVDAVFSVAGLPGPALLRPRHGEGELHRRPPPHRRPRAQMRPGSAVVCVASNAGLGWQQELDICSPS